jgi:hypothetical protein
MARAASKSATLPGLAKPRPRSFHQDLVLNRWLLGFFNGDELKKLKERLGEDRWEGLHEDGQTLFFHQLTANLFNIDRITEPELRRYDLSIVRHWQTITAARNKREGHILQLKYFQYLSLLFTEIYLDWYFSRRQQLLDGLNTALDAFHADQTEVRFAPFTADDLNRLAFWNATGSGKTLLLHVNILQYLHHYQAGRKGVLPDKIILLTPNEGLSAQHLSEAQLSGFSLVSYFEKDKTRALKGTLEIIDINKLADEMGDKTVAVEAFEGDNLVLVDEGHRGTGKNADAWMRRRNAIISRGFAFEYSATFGQAVGKGHTVASAEEELLKNKSKTLFGTSSLKKLDPEQRAQLTLTTDDRERARAMAMREIYAKCTAFDYSYKFFYEDGYGKEFLILNLPDDKDDDRVALYFTACLLSFYQQMRLWETQRAALTDFNIEKPLWVFVGNKVSDDDSDILTVVRFLADFLNHGSRTLGWIADLIADRAQIVDERSKKNIFEKRFLPLMGESAESIFTDILKRLFNANGAQRLKLVNVKNSKGELALRVGDAAPFGLINIGDDSGFFTLAEEQRGGAFDLEEDSFGGALFGTINAKDSRLNVLIGSRKFTEGWSSWRVSTMGLLNMGQGEGSQIIQLFGRGVRLKGRGFSLKRTPKGELPKGLHLEKLETLNIFGVRADYMAKFKDYLREEGITPTDEILELDFPSRANLPAKSLKTLRLKDGYKDNQKHGFKRTRYPSLYETPAAFIDAETGRSKIKPPHVVVDLYPRIQALASGEAKSATKPTDARQTAKLVTEAMRFFDWDRIFLAVQEHKLLSSWSNLRVDCDRLKKFCLGDAGWYTLYVPASELVIRRMEDVRKQEDILIQLLTDFTERYYQALKNAYEGDFYEVISLAADHGSMLKLYHFEIEDTDDGNAYLQRLQALQEIVAAGKIGEAGKWEANQMVAICFDRHLYYPLLHLEAPDALPFKMRPLAFDGESEVRFVRDLEAFYRSEAGKKAIGGRSLYLLRNAATKDKGIGFATAGNFYPDFLLWLVDETTGKQWLSVVDPKGIRNVDIDHPKLRLYREIKNVEKRLNDPNLTLNAFILSGTPFTDILNLGGKVTRSDFEDRHVLFMEAGRDSYLGKLFAQITD